MLPGLWKDTRQQGDIDDIGNVWFHDWVQSFNCHIVNGSSEHCFDAHSLMMATILSMLTCWNTRKPVTGLSTKDDTD